MAARAAAVYRADSGRVKAQRGKVVSLSTQDQHAGPPRAKRTLGFEPQFKLQDAVKDLAEWMRRYMG